MTPETFIDKQEMMIGDGKFLISKLPAIAAQEVYGDIVRYSNEYGDIAMTFLPADLSAKLLSYSAYWNGKQWDSLDTEMTINQACKDVEVLIDLEAAMIRKNFGFLFNGKLQKVLEGLRSGKPVTSSQQ